jgi:hypothetical protein
VILKRFISHESAFAANLVTFIDDATMKTRTNERNLLRQPDALNLY